MRGRFLVVAILLGSLLGCTVRSPSTSLPTRPWTAVPPSPTATPTATPRPTVGPTPTPTPVPTAVPVDVELRVEPVQIEPGHTLVVRLLSPWPVMAEGTLGEATLPFVSCDGGRLHTALVGIPVDAPEGPRWVVVRWQDAAGHADLLTATVELLPMRYPIETIYLQPDRAALLDPEIVSAEWERLVPIWDTWFPERLWSGDFITPTRGHISSAFGTLRSYDGGPPTSYHNGVDISNPEGTLVVAAARGRVVLAERLQVRGNAVILDHGWGVHSAYYHLSAILVEVGEMVEARQAIGRMGETGLATGPHLHWEVRLGEVPVDPWEWVHGGGKF
ncbi:MAG: M23 family metallopeptidase [Chloroflexia bacterium]